MNFGKLDSQVASKFDDLPGVRTLANTLVFDHIVPVQTPGQSVFRFFHHGGSEWRFAVIGIVENTKAGSFVKATGCTNVGIFAACFGLSVESRLC